MNLLKGLEMETEKMSDFIAFFHLVEYLRSFDDDTPVETVIAYLESDLEHYMSKGNKTLRDKFEIIQTKFFIEEIKKACVFNYKTVIFLVKLYTAHLNVNYMEKRDEI